MTHVFSGQVTQVGGAPGVSLGDAVTGTLVYDTTQVPVFTPSARADYDLFSFDLVSGTFSASRETGVLRVTDNFNAATVLDAFTMEGVSSGAGFGLTDTSGTAFSSTALPLALNIGDFDQRFMSVINGGSLFVSSIDTIQTSVVGAQVPLPASGLLLLPAIGLLVAVGRRRKQAAA